MTTPPLTYERGGAEIAAQAGRGTGWELRALNPQITTFEGVDYAHGGARIFVSPFLCIVGGYLTGPPTYAYFGEYRGQPNQLLSYLETDPLVYLRMNQRDDGLGISGHPRLPAAQGSTAEQSSLRVGGRNTYI